MGTQINKYDRNNQQKMTETSRIVVLITNNEEHEREYAYTK